MFYTVILVPDTKEFHRWGCPILSTYPVDKLREVSIVRAWKKGYELANCCFEYCRTLPKRGTRLPHAS